MRGRLKRNRRRTREQRILRLFLTGAACVAVLIFCGASLVSYLSDALQAKQTSALRLLEETWKPQYVIETHPELLLP